MKRWHALTVCAAWLVAGTRASLANPAALPAGLPLDPDERQIWVQVQEERATLDGSGFLAPWPEVEAYLNGVVTQLHPAPLLPGVPLRVHVLIDPSLNAFALPDGTIYIHTGMLARLENEAQLAAVVGHELVHATGRHAVKSYRHVKSQSALVASITVGTMGVGALLVGVGARASVSGYSKDLEREADIEGFRLMTAAGYDGREAPKVFRALLAESKRSKIKEPFFFGSHPRLNERIASFEQLVATQPARSAAARTGGAEYTTILPAVLAANAGAALRAGDFDFAQGCAERCLKLRPTERLARYELAEICRKRGGNGDPARALELYRELTRADPDDADAQRGLGLVLMKAGDRAGAGSAFERYLHLRPAAEDRAHIQAFRQQCQSNS